MKLAGTLLIGFSQNILNISHYLCTIDRSCERFSGGSTVAPPRARELLGLFWVSGCGWRKRGERRSDH
jgi:hypothetical protein